MNIWCTGEVVLVPNHIRPRHIWPSDRNMAVEGYCPGCGERSLFLADGLIQCLVVGCPDHWAVSRWIGVTAHGGLVSPPTEPNNDIQALRQTLSFLRSVILRGEPLTTSVSTAIENANDRLTIMEKILPRHIGW